jgi:hypothetical protein
MPHGGCSEGQGHILQGIPSWRVCLGQASGEPEGKSYISGAQFSLISNGDSNSCVLPPPRLESWGGY